MKKISSLLLMLIVSCSSPEQDVDDYQTQIQNYSLAVTAGDGGTVNTIGGTYERGATVTLTATPNSEFIFTGWSNGSTENPLTITINANTTITASFTKRSYPLTVSVSGEGSVNEEVVSSGKTTTEYTSGSVVRLTASPSSGWEFSRWSGSVSATTNPLELTLNEAKTVTATFERLAQENTYMTVAQGNGTLEVVSVAAPDQNGNIAVVVTATPAEGFIVWDFQGADLTPDQFEPIYNLKGAQTITLNFKGGDTTPAQVYFAPESYWVETPGWANSLEWHVGRGDNGYGAVDALNYAFENSSTAMQNAMLEARIAWFPQIQELPNNQSHTREANTAGGTRCTSDDSDHIIDMRHNSTAGIVWHEIGHNFDDDCSITPEQNARAAQYHADALANLIADGGTPSDHYQLGFGNGEFFACSVAAYFNTTDHFQQNDGHGTISNGYPTGRAGLQAKYPRMYDLMVEIFE